jgi:hypothetical protein
MQVLYKNRFSLLKKLGSIMQMVSPFFYEVTTADRD